MDEDHYRATLFPIMIQRFYRSKSDIENLSRFKTILENVDEFDYHKVVVNKPWGYEYLMFQNDTAAAWVLHINYNQATSMHCHPNKKTSLVVLSGIVTCSTLEGWLHLNAGDAVIIEEGVFHTTKALTSTGVLLVEVESPPNKKDLVRLKDAYGREKNGYEGVGSMSRNLPSYEYADLHGSKTIVHLGDALISLGRKKQLPKGNLLCLLSGSIVDKSGMAHIMTGETASITGASRLKGSHDILYLTFTYGKKR